MMCRLRTYLSLSAVKTSQNLPNDGATPTLRNGRVQLLSGHLDCFNGPRPAATSHKRPRKQRKVGLWNCLRAVRSDSPVLEGRPTVLHNIDHIKIVPWTSTWRFIISLQNVFSFKTELMTVCATCWHMRFFKHSACVHSCHVPTTVGVQLFSDEFHLFVY